MTDPYPEDTDATARQEFIAKKRQDLTTWSHKVATYHADSDLRRRVKRRRSTTGVTLKAAWVVKYDQMKAYLDRDYLA